MLTFVENDDEEKVEEQRSPNANIIEKGPIGGVEHYLTSDYNHQRCEYCKAQKWIVVHVSAHRIRRVIKCPVRNEK